MKLIFFLLSNLLQAAVHPWCMHIVVGASLQELPQKIEPDLIAEGDKKISQLLAENLFTYLANQPRESSPVEYSGVLGTTRTEGSSLHGQSLRGWSTDDRKVVLLIPKNGETRLWDHLNFNEKKLMAFYLERLLWSGKYDVRFQTPGLFPTPILAAMYTLIGKENGISTPTKGIGLRVKTEVGISPSQFLKESSCGGLAGVCRQGNYALAGLLGEMGIPAENIRIVAGLIKTADNKSARHVWLEVRFEPEGEWYELDGTARGISPVRTTEELNAHGSHMLGFRKPTTLQLRERLLDKPHIIQKFLTPIPFDVKE